ncbi:MAG: hypothetical protein J0626_01805, partial [Rhodospirillaceae bacterium]|nr:hypothetical protein [Rhodospirillaceae bacterium]
MKKQKNHGGLPSREQILKFITDSSQPAGKREITKAFGLKGQEKILLKALLKDMGDATLIYDDANGFELEEFVKKIKPDLVGSGIKEKYIFQKMG